MGHLTHEQLQDILDAAARKVQVGAQYRHYKNQTYTVTGLALLEETDEPAVIYRADYGMQISFIRPLSNWLETVEVNGRQVPRFSLVTSQQAA